MAPEMFNRGGTYTKLVDMWSVGVIMYRLLSGGKIPFDIEELKELGLVEDKSIEDKFERLACSERCLHLLRRLL